MAKHRKTVFDRPDVAYVKCVLSDPEFISEADSLLAQIKVGDDNHITHGRDNGKVGMIIGDNPVRRVPVEIIERFEKLSLEFDIPLREVVSYLNGFSIETGTNAWVETTNKYDPEENYPFWRIHIGQNATKKDVLNILDSFDFYMEAAYGSRIIKDKGPENYQLVYAIVRARKKHLTFNKIYKLYQDGELPSYKGAKGLGSVEKLKQYFYKYRPSGTT